MPKVRLLNSGKILLSISVLTILLSMSVSTHLVYAGNPTVTSQGTCKGIDKSQGGNWQPINVTDTFSTVDDAVFSFANLENVDPPVDIKFVWVPPHEFQMGGQTYTKLENDPIKLHFQGSGSIYDSLTIARPDTALPVGIWEVQVYWNSTLLSTAQFTLQPSIDIVGKSRSPTESEPLYAGNTLTVTHQLRNTGKTILKSVRFDMNTPLPRGANLVEATSPKDMSPGVDAIFAVMLKFDTEGAYEIRLQLYVDNILVQESPVTARVSILAAGLVASKPSYAPGEMVTLTISCNVPANYVLTIKAPSGAVWAKASGILPATFTKKATQPAGTYKAELSVQYSGAYAVASTTFAVAIDTYNVTISLTGLPGEVNATLQIDGTKAADMKSGDVRTLTYPVGTSHAIQISQYVGDGGFYRYYCASNSWTINTTGSHVFKYVTQVHLDTNVTPPEAGSVSPADTWYNNGTEVKVTATASTPAFLFDHWEEDGKAMGSAQPFTINMDSPHQLTVVFLAALTTKTSTSTSQTGTTASTVTSNTTSSSSSLSTSTTIPTTGPSSNGVIENVTENWLLIIIVLVVVLASASAVIMIRRVRARPKPPGPPSTRICPHCGFNNPPFTKAFCVKCGNPLEVA